MKTSTRITLATATLLLASAVSASAESRTYFGFQIGVVGAPPPPVVFYEPPPVYMDPVSRVYVVDPHACDYDVFRYGSSWYLSYGGYWYRAPRYRGPFRVVDARYVPRPIFTVPAQRWRHREWSPWAYRDASGPWHEGDHRHGHGKGHGNGHGNAHGHDRDD